MTTPTPPRRLEPPADFNNERREVWREAVDRLTASGRVFRADPEVLTAYVEAVVAHRQSARLVGQTNVLITRGDRAVENPALPVMRKAADAMARASRNLGLDKVPGDPMRVGDPADPSGGARWCDRHSRHECTKHKRRCGHPTDLPPPPEGCCHQPNITGTAACRNHAGKTLAQARQDGQVAMARLYGRPVDIDPIAGLLEEVRWAWGHVCALRQLVEQIEADDTTASATQPGGALFWGRSYTLTRDGIEVERRDVAGEHVILQAYNREREHFTRVCAAAIHAGAQQQAVDVAKAAGAGLGRLLEVIFAALFALPGELAGLPGAAAVRDWQQAQIPVIVPAAIREWNPDTAALPPAGTQ